MLLLHSQIFLKIDQKEQIFYSCWGIIFISISISLNRSISLAFLSQCNISIVAWLGRDSYYWVPIGSYILKLKAICVAQVSVNCFKN